MKVTSSSPWKKQNGKFWWAAYQRSSLSVSILGPSIHPPRLSVQYSSSNQITCLSVMEIASSWSWKREKSATITWEHRPHHNLFGAPRAIFGTSYPQQISTTSHTTEEWRCTCYRRKACGGRDIRSQVKPGSELEVLNKLEPSWAGACSLELCSLNPYV